MYIDVRGAYYRGDPVLFWTNRGDPFVVGNQQTAANGKVADQRFATDGLAGFPMIVEFILAKASHIKSWQEMVFDDPFDTTELHSTFDTGFEVKFSYSNPIVYANTVLKDRKYDINQDIFNESSSKYLRGFDVWAGTMQLIITSGSAVDEEDRS